MVKDFFVWASLGIAGLALVAVTMILSALPIALGIMGAVWFYDYFIR